MRFVLGADEYEPVLDVIERELCALGHDVSIIGARPDSPAPWGNVAVAVAERVAAGGADQGIVCCYTGTGVSMAANKVRGIRAALCVDAETARGARQWNDANVLALSLRLTSPAVAKEIVRAWVSTAYGGTEGPSLETMQKAEEKGA
ncbi:MAG TPA: RpiB/LacA/LacB family sugar-phosphate isomerase [Polyangiaceae bacterium]|nr:RpiB/LacA/LacB family sugar-phosphate isomerase [Polyangiaceae bacterium]